MSFTDWKRRSEACANVMTYSVPTRTNILRALQAAYKAGERDGRKQVEAVAGNAIGLAVLAERERCANICDHEQGAAGDAAAKIRMRSNVKLTGDGQLHRPASE